MSNVPPIELSLIDALKMCVHDLKGLRDKYSDTWKIYELTAIQGTICDAVAAMGEPLTEPQGGEAKRNECDCLRRPDSEGMPAGETASPANSSEIRVNSAEQEAKCREAHREWFKRKATTQEELPSLEEAFIDGAAWSAAQPRTTEQVVSVDDAQTAFYQEMRRQGFATNDIDHIDSGSIVKAVLDAAGVKYVD